MGVPGRSRRSDVGSTGSGCLHLDVSLLLGVEGTVPILLIAVYLGYLLSVVYLGYLFIAVREKKHLRVAGLYTRSRAFESLRRTRLSEPCGKIGDGVTGERDFKSAIIIWTSKYVASTRVYLN